MLLTLTRYVHIINTHTKRYIFNCCNMAEVVTYRMPIMYTMVVMYTIWLKLSGAPRAYCNVKYYLLRTQFTTSTIMSETVQKKSVKVLTFKHYCLYVKCIGICKNTQLHDLALDSFIKCTTRPYFQISIFFDEILKILCVNYDCIFLF